jgi:hypothetical protein
MIIELPGLMQNRPSEQEERVEKLLKPLIGIHRKNPKPLVAVGCAVARLVISEAISIIPRFSEHREDLNSPIIVAKQWADSGCENDILETAFQLSRSALSKSELAEICLAPLRSARFFDDAWLKNRPVHEHDFHRREGVRGIVMLMFPEAAQKLCELRGLDDWDSDQAAITTAIESAILELPSVTRQPTAA